MVSLLKSNGAKASTLTELYRVLNSDETDLTALERKVNAFLKKIAKISLESLEKVLDLRPKTGQVA